LNPEPLAAADHEAWDRFVEQAPGGHLFLTAAWHAAWGATPEVVAARDGAGAIVAGVAYVRGRALGGAAIRRPPFTAYNHPLIDVARLRRVSDQLEAMSALIAAVDGFRRVDFTFRWDAPLAALSFMQRGYENRLGVSYVIPAEAGADWRAGLSRSHRRYLKKTGEEVRSGRWRIERDAPLTETWPLFEATGAAKSFRVPAAREAFGAALEALRARDRGEVWSLRDERGVLRACTFLARDERCAYYLCGGLRPADRSGFWGNYALFEAMIDDTARRGLAFDFEGSSLPGVERFFRGFGGELRTVVRQVLLQPFALTLLWSAGRSLERRRSRRVREPRGEGA
jgi:hypothetical protein